MKVSWFSLQGFIDYLPLGFKIKKKLGGDVATPFDLFSFGAESEKTTDKTTGKGLYFSDLGVEMNYTMPIQQIKHLDLKLTKLHLTEAAVLRGIYRCLQILRLMKQHFCREQKIIPLINSVF